MYIPTLKRPMILNPATDVWITGIISDNSPSKTLYNNKSIKVLIRKL